MSKKVTKIAVATLSTIMLIGSTGGQVSAEPVESYAESSISSVGFPNGAVIKSFNNNNVLASLSISDTGTAKGMVRITGKSNATKISATTKIQRYDSSKKSWVNVIQWSESVNSHHMSLINSHSLRARGNYRLYVSVNVWSGDKKETLTKISSQKTY